MGDLRRLIAFDLDGTLIDSRRDLADSANQLLGELGRPALSLDAITGMVGEGARVLIERALAASGLAEVPDALPRFLEIYDTRLLNFTRPYDGVVEAVELARGHARVALLTNKPLKPSERILEALGMRGLFDDVIGGDGAFPRKPDPTGLLELMARANATPERTLMVGDSLIDQQTASRASVRFCLAGYGFGFPREQLTGDEWIVSDGPELVNAIARFTAAG